MGSYSHRQSVRIRRSNKEILQAAEFHAESGLKEWVTAVVKLEVNEDGGADVHFEAFQMSDNCVKLFKDGLFETEIAEDDDPKLSKMKKDVVVGVKDTREVDNDFFLVVVKIFDHQVWLKDCIFAFVFSSCYWGCFNYVQLLLCSIFMVVLFVVLIRKEIAKLTMTMALINHLLQYIFESL